MQASEVSSLHGLASWLRLVDQLLPLVVRVRFHIRPEARNLDQLIIWITQTVATVLSSGKNTNTDSMRACMKIHKIQILR